ncbi:hypothetical protein Avbf_08983 [Armadillidium vulgare]|nr:hypothetical protein Avbf_08983 [Armadillidium vulgare]
MASQESESFNFPNVSYKIEDLKYRYDSVLKFIILEGTAKERLKVFVPINFTYTLTPRLIREIKQHFSEVSPQASYLLILKHSLFFSVILAIFSSDGILGMYEIEIGLCLPRKVCVEDLKKTHISDEHSGEET